MKIKLSKETRFLRRITFAIIALVVSAYFYLPFELVPIANKEAIAKRVDVKLDTSISCAFSRDEQAQEAIIFLIREARETILVAAYSFTSKPIATELVEASKRGVKVYVVADDKANKSKYTAVTFLANNKIPVRLNDKYAIMHHKFMVVDSKHVQTGSFNYSAAANNRNAENILVLWNNQGIAHEYSIEWSTLWNESKDLPPNY